MSSVDASSQLPWYREIDRSQWKAFVAAWLGYFLDGFDFVIMSLVLTDVRDELGISTVAAASLVSAAFISRWFGGLLLGAVSDRFGRREAMVASIVLFSVGSVLCAVAPWFWLLFAARLLIGLGMAGEYSASSTYVIESWPAHLRNKASGFLISGFSIGTIVSAQAYGWIVPNWGWRTLFAVGLIPILAALWLRRALPESRDWEHANQRRQDKQAHAFDMFSVLYRSEKRALNLVLTLVAFIALIAIFTRLVTGWVLIPILAVVLIAIFVSFMKQFSGPRWPTGVGLMIVVFFAFLYSWPIQSLLPTYLHDTLNMDEAQTADLLFYSGFGAAVGCIVAGFTGDRFGTRRAYWVSLVVSELLIFPVFAVQGDQVVLLGLLLFLQQVFGQGISGLLPKWIGSYFSVDQRGAGLGFVYNVGALGGAIAPVVGAALAETMTLGQALAVLSFSLTAIVIVLMAINLPYRMQRGLRPRAVWETDSQDWMPPAHIQAPVAVPKA